MHRSLALVLPLFMASTVPSNAPKRMLFDFNDSTPADAWEVEDDVVMGGRSKGQLEMTDEGHARFYGHVSLANDGGFSSIQHELDPVVDASNGKAFLVRLKGDSSNYTLRVRSQPDQGYFHQATFPTSGEWQTVRVPFESMSAVSRGEPVDVPNFKGGPVQKVQFLIGNKQEQDFEVLVDWIGVE